MKNALDQFVQNYCPVWVSRMLIRYGIIVKYLFSGGLATATDLVAIFVFVDVVEFHYLTASILAFLIAFCVSFTMQKYWTFNDLDHDRIHKQLASFLTLSLINLVLNTALMKLFVDVFHVWYLLSQIIIAALIACMSFFIYRYVIFNRPDTP